MMDGDPIRLAFILDFSLTRFVHEINIHIVLD
ncbi:hypothetical protein LINGRAHAP2_LOCUS34198 [Linum grandiflorum]